MKTKIHLFLSVVTSLFLMFFLSLKSYAFDYTITFTGTGASITVESVIVQKVYAPPTTVTDKDGNVYQTVTIGTQTWMASNLRVIHYRNGESITNLTVDADWVGAAFGAWCDYSNLAANGTNYGHLYNWYAASDSRNIAPVGWHIPTDAEWTTLTTYLGGTSVAGGKLKEAGTLNWLSPNTGATNETGFSALPAGYRYSHDGTFYSLGDYGFWWSATEDITSYAWTRTMDYDDGDVGQGFSNESGGFSVRCVRDSQ